MHLKHGHTYRDENGVNCASPTYRSWTKMKYRCRNSNYEDSHRYHGRGITYDPSWEDFEVFLRDMGERPLGKTLDRIDNDGNYCKENCRWATPEQQVHNSTLYKHGHGLRKLRSKEFRCWDGMKQVCTNPNHTTFKGVGAKGISFDPAWNDFNVFLSDVGHAPSPRHQLHRIDKNKRFEKDNCEWRVVSKAA